MSSWAAARCTSAAVPYFKAFEWQGNMLLDGGFQLNCCADCAYSEAKSIWPDKRRDILLSLGTGKATRPKPPSRHSFIRLANGVAGHIVNAEGAWEKFITTNEQKDRMFRLNPRYGGVGFEVDDFQKLDEIENQAEEWMNDVSQNGQLTDICDRLIAALFFFRMIPADDGVRGGEILCRLPASLLERQNLVHGMREADSKFVVEYNGRSGPIYEDVDVKEAFASLNVTAELRFPVKLHNLVVTDEIAVHVKMRISGTRKYLHISGSPYVIRSEA